MPHLLLSNAGTNPEATMLRWLVSSGEQFVVGQALAEFEIENGQLIVEAPAAGCLTELLIQPGQTVVVGAKLAHFEAPNATRGIDSTSEQRKEAMPEGYSTNRGKVIPVLMPQAGNTMEEGTVTAWRVKEGDQIAVGQVICEIETDKATIDFECPDAGRLARIVARVGEPVAVKKVIALLADSDADAEAYVANSGGAATSPKSRAPEITTSTGANGKKQERSVAATPVASEGRVKASPAARKVATARGVSLAAISSGSGPEGRILSTDVENCESPVISAAPILENGESRRPLSKMRRAIGLNLQQSKQTIPHFYVRATINAGQLLAFYREHKATATCTLNDVIVLAVGRAMREFPAVRSQIVGNEIVEYPHANIGIAVGVEEGLVVPVLVNVDTLSLARLAAETRRIVEQARNGRLENIGKGHFTISNLGMFGVEEFSAIINPPESGILAVSAAREAVIVDGGAMRVGHQMTMTLSADHRIVDGVTAAKFMQRLRAILEHPDKELT
jgi:pyruvate dehydrogenase E2 component (dihydrolipoamide acetyltransferase)